MVCMEDVPHPWTPAAISQYLNLDLPFATWNLSNSLLKSIADNIPANIM